MGSRSRLLGERRYRAKPERREIEKRRSRERNEQLHFDRLAWRASLAHRNELMQYRRAQVEAWLAHSGDHDTCACDDTDTSWMRPIVEKRRAHNEKEKERLKAYYDEHRLEIIAKSNAYYEENRDRILAYRKARYQENKNKKKALSHKASK